MKINEILTEKWSAKYKKSINCSHPKGFSQKAHCAGKRKHNESIEQEMTCPDCGMCETHGDHSRDTIDEACWKGYHKEGMKTMFGKRYPNCVKNEDVLEGKENFNGIDISMEIEKDDEDYDNHTVIYVTASGNGKKLGHVVFLFDGEYLLPQDLEVEERFRGQGIAQTIYDYVKSKGYKIRRSGQQTDAGAGFWQKHRPDQNIWEQGVGEGAELCPECGGSMYPETMITEKQDACYYKVKSRYKVWPSAYASGALVQCRKKGAKNWGNKSESIEEDLHKWFKEKWVRFGPDGKIKGDCARGSSSEGKPKCLPQSKAHSLGKKGRASAAAKKRRQDPNPERSGKAINVKTKRQEDVEEAANAAQQAAIAINMKKHHIKPKHT